MQATFQTLPKFLAAIEDAAKRADVPFNVQSEKSEDPTISQVIFIWLAEHVNVHIEVGDSHDDEEERWFHVTWSHGRGNRSSARHLTRTAIVDIVQALHTDWKSDIRTEEDYEVWHVLDDAGERKLQISHRDSDRVINLNDPIARAFFGVPMCDPEHNQLWEIYLESKLDHLVSAVEWRDATHKMGERRAVLTVPGQGKIEVYYG